MSAITSDTNETPRETARERASRLHSGTARPKRPASARPAPPTRSIEPGAVHYRIAEGLLGQIQARARAIGVTLDIGDMVTGDENVKGSDDPQALVKIVAHAVARMGDRFRFLRKFSRHFEGQEKRAGILADIVAAIIELYKRNPDQMESLVRAIAADVKEKQASRVSKSNASQNGNGTVPRPVGV